MFDACGTGHEPRIAERDALLLNTRLEVEKLKVLLARAKHEQYGQSSERLAAE
jgi:hypothetical protein